MPGPKKTTGSDAPMAKRPKSPVAGARSSTAENRPPGATALRRHAGGPSWGARAPGWWSPGAPRASGGRPASHWPSGRPSPCGTATFPAPADRSALRGRFRSSDRRRRDRRRRLRQLLLGGGALFGRARQYRRPRARGGRRRRHAGHDARRGLVGRGARREPARRRTVDPGAPSSLVAAGTGRPLCTSRRSKASSGTRTSPRTPPRRRGCSA